MVDLFVCGCQLQLLLPIHLLCCSLLDIVQPQHVLLTLAIANVNLDMRTNETPLSDSGIKRQQYMLWTKRQNINRLLGRERQIEERELIKQMRAATERTSDILVSLSRQNRYTGATEDLFLAISALSNGSAVNEHLTTKLVEKMERKAQQYKAEEKHAPQHDVVTVRTAENSGTPSEYRGFRKGSGKDSKET